MDRLVKVKVSKKGEENYLRGQTVDWLSSPQLILIQLPSPRNNITLCSCIFRVKSKIQKTICHPKDNQCQECKQVKHRIDLYLSLLCNSQVTELNSVSSPQLILIQRLSLYNHITPCEILNFLEWNPKFKNILSS